jgi:hypothetical protein
VRAGDFLPKRLKPIDARLIKAEAQVRQLVVPFGLFGSRSLLHGPLSISHHAAMRAPPAGRLFWQAAGLPYSSPIRPAFSANAGR